MKLLLLLLAIVLAMPALAQSDLVVREIVPSAADPGVKRFDLPSVAVAKAGLSASAPLVVYLPGTGGSPANLGGLLRVVAGQGYRVLGLEYDDVPAVVQVCTHDPDPDCAADFREMRIAGTGKSKQVSSPPAEAIVPRLVAALRALDKAAPGEGWGGYLDGGEPRWERIVISGMSQGAGMAAFIAKHHAVRRAVLFSSPWETTGADAQPAPWFAGPSATPMDRWFAEYNARENTAKLIKAAYAALRIPADHVQVFSLDLAAGAGRGPNPYHGATSHDPRYAPQWRALFGTP